MGERMRLSKAAREKVKKEAALYEQALYFILSNIKDPSDDDLLRVALKNIQTVLRDLDVIISSSSKTTSSSSSLVDDVSSIIIKNSSKVEDELIYICENCNLIETKLAFEEFRLHFIRGDLTKYRSKVYYSRYAPDDINTGKGGSRKEKEKAPQLTELERKQQEDDEEKCRVYREKLNKESHDYHTTLRFMLSFLKKTQVTNREDRVFLFYAYSNIVDVEFDLQYSNKSDEVLCKKDVSLMVPEYRSKVENELQRICDNVSNLTVKEAYTQHLDDFRTGFKLSAQDHHSHLQNEDRKIMSSKPKMSLKKKKKKSKLRLRGKGGSGSCKTPSYLHAPRHHHDHSDCCKKNHLETFDLDWHYSPILRARGEKIYDTRVSGI